MIGDLLYSLRILFKRPGFAILAIMTFALGIGANTVIFSGVYALFIQRLSYPNSERIVVVSQVDKNGVESGVSFPDLSEWKQQNGVFEQMAAFKNVAMNLSGGAQVERVSGSLVSQEFMPLLGGSPQVGRGFLPEDFIRGARTILLSHPFWRRRFGGDAGAVGRKLDLDGEVFTIIGVMPENFQYPFHASFWAPLEALEKPESLSDRSANTFGAVALLKPGLSTAAAADEISALAARSAAENWMRQQELAVKVISLRDSLPWVGKYRTPVLVLQLAVAFVLLIACVNLANMLLARNTERRQEFTIRLALGAGRTRLIRQLLAESMTVGLLGAVFGLALAVWGIGALKAAIPWRVPGAPEIEINTPVLLVTLAVSLLTSLGFGLAPAIIASRQDLNASLKSGTASTTPDRGQKRLSRALVCSEISLAVTLLVAAVLMARTFLNLTNEDPGFDPEGAVALSVSLPQSRYPEHENLAGYYDALFREIKSLPGVESVGGVTYMPLVGYNPGTAFTIEGHAPPSREAMPEADFQPVTPGYFQAIGVPLLSGRDFNGSDVRRRPETVIINGALARRYWPGEDPLGRRIQVNAGTPEAFPAAVVGVVGDVKQFGLNTEPRPEIYLPAYRHSMTVIIRASADAGGYSAPLREIVERLDGSGTALTLRTLEQVVIDSIERKRIFTLLLGVLAGVAVLLAAMGIYGVISYLVSQRTREIGIRMAMGAQGHDILRSIVGQGVRLALIGTGAGLAASILLTRAMRGLLYGVGVIEPAVFAGIALAIIALAALASYIPARRASKVDPVLALKCE